MVGQWLALDRPIHLLHTEKFYFSGARSAFSRQAIIYRLNPDQEGALSHTLGQPPETLAAQFSTLRAASAAQIRALVSEDLQRTALHAELGR